MTSCIKPRTTFMKDQGRDERVWIVIIWLKIICLKHKYNFYLIFLSYIHYIIKSVTVIISNNIYFTGYNSLLTTCKYRIKFYESHT